MKLTISILVALSLVAALGSASDKIVSVPINLAASEGLLGYTVPLVFHTSQPSLVRLDSVVLSGELQADVHQEDSIIIMDRPRQAPPLPDSGIYDLARLWFTIDEDAETEDVEIDTITFDGSIFQYINENGDTTKPDYVEGLMEITNSGSNPIVTVGNTTSTVIQSLGALDGVTALIHNPGQGPPRIAGGELPDRFYLSQNYPNPFNPNTVIAFGLPQAGHVRLTVFNLLGQTVAILVDDDYSAGEHSAEWNSADNEGRSISSGVYFYRLETDGFIETRKMMLLK